MRSVGSLAVLFVLALAACTDPVELPESMRLTGVPGTAMINDAACSRLVGAGAGDPSFAMNVRNRSDPAACTCASESAATGSSPCSFDGNRMTCMVNDGLTIWHADFDAEAMTAAVTVTRGPCSGSVQATVADLTEN